MSLRFFLALLVFAVLPLDFAHALEKNIALVIGNSAYRDAPALVNPTSDARDIAAALRDLGFDVILRQDADQASMRSAVRELSRRLVNARTVVIFYAGHGIQVGGNNYLVPIDVKIETMSDVRFSTIDLGAVLEEIGDEKRISLVFLDACRDNPFAGALSRATRSFTAARGLAAPTSTGVGTLIAFSTQPNNVALDGEGRNSPFAAALLRHIATPGLEVQLMLKRVRADVIEATRQKQIPWDNSSLTGEVFLRPIISAKAEDPSQHQPPNKSIAQGQDAAELALWESVKNASNPQFYDEYLRRFPTGVFAGIARLRIEELRRSGQVDTENLVRGQQDGNRIAGLSPPQVNREPAIVPPAAPSLPPLSGTFAGMVARRKVNAGALPSRFYKVTIAPDGQTASISISEGSRAIATLTARGRIEGDRRFIGVATASWSAVGWTPDQISITFDTQRKTVTWYHSDGKIAGSGTLVRN